MNRPLSSIASLVGTTSLIAGPVLGRRVGAARAVALVSTALTMGMSFAHTLDIPGKRSYDGRLWWHLSRTLYRPWWGRAGQLEGVALGAAPALAYCETAAQRTG